MAQSVSARRLAELETAIEKLEKKEYDQLRRWFLERDWQDWDRQVEADARSGKLEFLAREARQAKSLGKLRDL
ncbi:MAG: hypothetical protein R6X13_12315 [bacterium]